MFKRHFLQRSIGAIFVLFLSIASFSETGHTFGQIIKETTHVDQLTVSIRHHKGVFWQAEIQNNDSKLPITIFWDKSSYLSSGGRSSRLIQEGRTNIHPSELQEPAMILAQQKAKFIFTGEDLLPYAGGDHAPAPSNSSARGYLTLTFKKNGALFFWKSSIQFIN